MIDHAIDYLESYGFDRIIINVHHFGEQIIDHIKSQHYKAEIIISDERSALKDTGGALVAALPLMNEEESILIFNTDVITDLNLHELASAHESSDSSATLIVQERDNFSRGRQVDYVLGKWDKKELETLPDIIKHAAGGVFAFGTIGITETMNKFTKK